MLKRLKEPSTYAGIAAIIAGGGMIAKVNEAPAVAHAVSSAGAQLAAGDYFGAAMIFFGAFATFMKERGNNE